MKLPGGDRAVVEDAKVQDYLLNPAHPVGGPKAKLFKLLLGLDRSDWRTLKAALLTAARDGDALAGRASSYGQKFELRFQMTGSRGAYSILSIWMIVTGDSVPRLVTAYIE